MSLYFMTLGNILYKRVQLRSHMCVTADMDSERHESFGAPITPEGHLCPACDDSWQCATPEPLPGFKPACLQRYKSLLGQEFCSPHPLHCLQPSTHQGA